jgi:uncharacterized protein (AIM24 family)
MNYKISGDNLQIVTLEIDPNELVYAEAGAMVYMSGLVYAEAGAMVYMSGNVYMEAKARGGLWKGFKRTLMGETFFLTEFYSHGGPGLVAFAGNAPGTIKALQLVPGRDFLVQKDAFLCASCAKRRILMCRTQRGS